MTRSIKTLLLTVALATAVPAVASAAAPTAITGAATGVSPNAATVNGAVNPRGKVTTYYFQYGKTKSYGRRTTAVDAGSGTKRVPVSAQLTGLANKTTYHYRLVATNSDGSTFGGDRTFKTPETPTVSTIASSRNPATYGHVVVITGFLAGPRGGANKQVALEANPFPYTAGFQQFGNTVVTGPDGGYSFVTPALLNAQFRVADRSDPSIVSPVLTQNVAPSVSLKGKRHSGSHVVRFSGHVRPSGAASAVVIERRTHKGGWKKLKVVLPRKHSRGDRFSKRIRTRHGVFRAVARPNGGAYVTGVSKRIRR